MKTSFLPKTNEIIGMISAHYIIEQKFWQSFRCFLGEMKKKYKNHWKFIGFILS